MNRFFLMVLLAVGLAACASQQRMGPPAPVVTTTSPKPKPVREEPMAQPAPAETVEVYPYRPPSSAPDAATPAGEVAAERGIPKNGTGITEKTTEATVTSVPAERPSHTGTSAVGTPPAPAQQVVAYAPPPPAPSLSPAADALMKQAEQQRQTRDYVGAAATLERALGIQPREPHIWNRLARVRTEQGLYGQAGNLAKRSNDLAGDQVALKQDNWRMIATARRAAGDAAGAAEAERKARGG